MGERIQKLLAQAGLGSRRQLEDIIRTGRVTVNGKTAALGDRAEEADEVRVDGRLIAIRPAELTRRRVILYYKPEGEVCTMSDPEGRPTVFEQLPQIKDGRWIMVGRLDLNSSGLLLFTNDGELANRLMHPSSEIEREYAVRTMGVVTSAMRETLTSGVMLDDGEARFERMSDLGGEGFNRWYSVVLREGRNREVRRMLETQGLKVSRLLRTRYGVVQLPRELRTGRWMEMSQSDLSVLEASVGVKPRLQTIQRNQTVETREAKPLPARFHRRNSQQDRTSSRPAREGQSGEGQNRSDESRSGRTRSTQPRHNQARPGQTGSSQARDSQAKNGQARDNRATDGQASHSRTRASHSRDHQSRDSHSRDGQVTDRPPRRHPSDQAPARTGARHQSRSRQGQGEQQQANTRQTGYQENDSRQPAFREEGTRRTGRKPAV